MATYSLLQNRIALIQSQHYTPLLKDSKTGIEKESLRVSADGRIAQTDHPKTLGSSLTHPSITTDYGEAMLEFITPPLTCAYRALDYLQDLQTFVYQALDDELLWTTSMPCIIRGETDIRIAEYGDSNAGQMKHAYRQGLANRYGKMMQVISGIHFNHSIAERFWPAFQELEQNEALLQDFIDDRYMGQVRNLLRYGWIIPYLFGSSPAICKTFLSGVPAPENMVLLSNNTYYEPHGTSLRMGDIGYTNNKECESGITANYNSISEYTASLRAAISTPYSGYESIGVNVGGQYRQLNTHLLQIENEYYSTVRPKQVLNAMEKPVNALDRRGIRYVELRSLDVNAMSPTGLQVCEIRFLEIFMLFCLLQESPAITEQEHTEIQKNQSQVAHLGRKPGLKLSRNGDSIALKAWGLELFEQMQPVAEMLDEVHDTEEYTQSLAIKVYLMKEPDATPSAIMVDELINNNESFFEYAKRYSEKHRDFFMQRTLSEERIAEFTKMRDDSLLKQQAIEQGDKVSFEAFLESYFSS